MRISWGGLQWLTVNDRTKVMSRFYGIWGPGWSLGFHRTTNYAIWRV